MPVAGMPVAGMNASAHSQCTRLASSLLAHDYDKHASEIGTWQHATALHTGALAEHQADSAF